MRFAKDQQKNSSHCFAIRRVNGRYLDAVLRYILLDLMISRGTSALAHKKITSVDVVKAVLSVLVSCISEKRALTSAKLEMYLFCDANFR